jgi:hypothetical protein
MPGMILFMREHVLEINLFEYFGKPFKPKVKVLQSLNSLVDHTFFWIEFFS